LQNGGSNYFDELYERVRHIRTSEANFYKKVTTIFTTSIDYLSSSKEAKTFYATVQNKFHYAIHRHTAAELITKRIDSKKDNLGLTTWKKKVVTKKDAVIAKNYLTEIEMKRLELLVEQFLVFAELQSVEKRPMYMADWVKKLDGFIALNDKEVLTSSGKVSRKAMESKVRKQLESYRKRKMAEEALAEDEFNKMLDEAEQELLQPLDDDLEDSGISREEYMATLEKVSKPLPSDKDKS
ncbi:MAG: RhuM family protein, partial [Anaerolineae bacterium]|nr:RhuM family protein [Anaerolineae bacterium]